MKKVLVVLPLVALTACGKNMCDIGRASIDMNQVNGFIENSDQTQTRIEFKGGGSMVVNVGKVQFEKTCLK